MDIKLISQQIDEINQYPLTPEESITKEEAKKFTNPENFKDFPDQIRINPYGSGEKFLKFLNKKETKERSNMAKLTGDILPLSCGYTYDNKMYITPYGGPTLIEGERVPNSDNILLINKIYYSDTIQHYILEIKRI